MILFIKKSPLWCKPGRRFFRSQCEDGFLTHLELPATPPPRAAWDTNSELLSPASPPQTLKKICQPLSITWRDACLSQPVWHWVLPCKPASGVEILFLWLHSINLSQPQHHSEWDHSENIANKMGVLCIFLCSGNISISFNTTIKLHFVQIELKSSPARQHMSHVWTTHVPTANWAHLVAGYVELTKPKIKNKKLQIF